MTTLIVIVIIVSVILLITLVFLFRLKTFSLKDEKRKLRKGKTEVTREHLNLSDGASLNLLQNDPWMTKCVVIAIPSFLSTRKEYVDMSLFFEEKDIKFFSCDLREQSWEGNSNNISLGTSLKDFKELIAEVKRIYPDKKVFLLGQSFGANFAHYMYNHKKTKVDGIVIANPLISNSKINYWNFTHSKFFAETTRLKKNLQFIDLRKATTILKQQTNNNPYTKEIIDLWERRYLHGVSIKFIAQAQVMINDFRKCEPIKERKNILFLVSSDFKQPQEHLGSSHVLVKGNELVFTDFLNEKVLEKVVLFLSNQ